MGKAITPEAILTGKAREKKIIQTSIIGIGGNVLLVAVKAFFGILSGSIAILTDALNNLTDALSSVITIIGTKLSGKAPDKKHPFGYGRIEYLTSMVIAVIILVAGGTSIVESIQALIAQYSGSGAVAIYSDLTLIIISIAILFKVGLGIYFRIMGKKTRSDALKASGTDALSDAALSLSTLVCGLIARFGGVSLEGYFGILIGLFILKSGFEALRDGASEIIGSRTDPALVHGIKALINAHEEVEGTYDLIVNSYGENVANASVHIQVKDGLSARDIHGLTKALTAEVYQTYGIALTVGIYASNDSDPEAAAIKNDLLSLIKGKPNLLQMHGFYVDPATKIITFDLIFTFEEKKPADRAEEVRLALQERYPDYRVIAILDTDYTD